MTAHFVHVWSKNAPHIFKKDSLVMKILSKMLKTAVLGLHV